MGSCGDITWGQLQQMWYPVQNQHEMCIREQKHTRSCNENLRRIVRNYKVLAQFKNLRNKSFNVWRAPSCPQPCAGHTCLRLALACTYLQQPLLRSRKRTRVTGVYWDFTCPESALSRNDGVGCNKLSGPTTHNTRGFAYCERRICSLNPLIWVSYGRGWAAAICRKGARVR